jgi:Na+/H+ antiporter NhaD/arsenite permease-like protein
LIVLIIAYLAISAGRIGRVKIRRDVAALSGGAAILLLGLATPAEAWGYIRFDVLLLLLGMMVMVVSLEMCGFFEIVVERLASARLSQGRLLAVLMIVCATLAALMLNDAVVLLFTPVVIRYACRVGLNPIPYLVGLFVSANIGSLATVVGNPQNAYIATIAGIDFMQFTSVMLPLTVVSLFVGIALTYLAYRNRLSADAPIPLTREAEAIDRPRLAVCTVVLLGTAVGFAISGRFGIPLYAVALVSGCLCLLTVGTRGPRESLAVAKKVDWSILLFFTGLFILMAGVVNSGLLADIAALFPGFADGETPSILGIGLFSAVLSNLVSNVPSVMLIGEMLPLDDIVLWLALAASSTLAGNATLMGAAANIIVADEADKEGVHLDFWRYFPVGMGISAITLLIAIGYLSLL